MKDKVTVILLAAGQGKRMNTDVAKQHIEIREKPVLYYSLKAFEDSDVDEIILVVREDEIEKCKKEYVDRYAFAKVKHIISGGKERYDSVYEGLKCASDCDYILIHDGARPLVTNDIINRVMSCVKEKKACITGMPSKDTVKVLNNNECVEETLDRNRVWMIQTPQAFSYHIIKKAYDERQKDLGKNITDDAMLLEMMGYPVYVVEGSYDNIKVTTPDDLILAEMFMNHR